MKKKDPHHNNFMRMLHNCCLYLNKWWCNIYKSYYDYGWLWYETHEVKPIATSLQFKYSIQSSNFYTYQAYNQNMIINQK